MFGQGLARLSALVFAFGLVGQASAEPARLFSYSPGIGPVGPQGALSRGPDGTVYAALYGLGSSGRGSVVAYTPPKTPDGSWSQNLIHSFNAAEGGQHPRAGVTLGPGGEIYGTTFQGGLNDAGVVFRLTPPVSPNAPWTKAVLHEFGSSVGGRTTTELLLGQDGAIYGTTYRPTRGVCCGLAFKLTPKGGGTLPWNFKVIARFSSTGYQPSSKFVRDDNGNIYSSFFYGGGRYSHGGVFMLSPQSDGSYHYYKIKTFSASNGPSNPIGNLALDESGRLVGTARNGGAYGCGSVFRLTPPPTGQTEWTFENLRTFQGGSTSGCHPIGVALSGEEIIVSTYKGGEFGVGTLMSLVPRSGNPSTYEIRLRENFGPIYNYPQRSPIVGPSGEIYGSTSDAISIWRSAP